MPIYGSYTLGVKVGTNTSGASSAGKWIKFASILESTDTAMDVAHGVFLVKLVGAQSHVERDAHVSMIIDVMLPANNEAGNVKDPRVRIDLIDAGFLGDTNNSQLVFDPTTFIDLVWYDHSTNPEGHMWFRTPVDHAQLYVTMLSGNLDDGDQSDMYWKIQTEQDWQTDGTTRKIGNTDHSTVTDGSYSSVTKLSTKKFDDVTLTGDLTVTGNDIKGSGGTAITMDGSNNVTVAGDLTISGGNITNAITFDSDITVNGDTVTFTSATSQSPLVRIKNTTNNANAGTLQFFKERTGANGADDDKIGTILFTSEDDGGTNLSYAEIVGDIRESEDGSETARMKFSVVADAQNPMIKGMEIRGSTATAGKVDIDLGAHATSLVTLAGNLKVGGNVIQASDGGTTITMDTSDNVTIGNDLTVGGGDIYGMVDGGLNLRADTHMKFYIDNDGDESSKEFQWYDDAIERMVLDQSGNLQIDGDLTVTGNDIIGTALKLDSSGDIMLSADGDQIIMDDGTTNRFTFNVDSTPELDVNGDFKLDCTATCEIEATDLTMDLSGNLIIDSTDATQTVQFKDGSSWCGFLEYGNKSNNGLSITVSNTSYNAWHALGQAFDGSNNTRGDLTAGSIFWTGMEQRYDSNTDRFEMSMWHGNGSSTTRHLCYYALHNNDNIYFNDHIFVANAGSISSGFSYLAARTSDGAVMKVSSRRALKKDIENLEDNFGLDTISKITPRKFKYKESDEARYGFIAEEIHEVDPILSTTGKDEKIDESGSFVFDVGENGERKHALNSDSEIPHYYDHAGLLSILVKSVQELKEENDSLKARLEALEDKI